MGFGSSREPGNGGRAGARVLSLLAMPLNREILDELSRGPRRLSELRHQIGSSQTTLRARLKQFGEFGIVTKRKLNPFPSWREYELTSGAGKELLFVITTLESWLASAPEEPLAFDSDAGRSAIRTLAESWSSTMLRALAAGPTRPTDLRNEVRLVDQVSLERRLADLDRVGLIARTRNNGGQTTYEITDWLRKGTAPIAAASRWERRHIQHFGPPLRPIDAEAGFLLAMPLLKPPTGLAGSCRLGVEFGSGKERLLVGVTVEVDSGRVVSCTTYLKSNPAAWASGPPEAWLRTAIDADPNRLKLGGDRRLVRGLIDALNQTLFGPARPLPPP